ncbi:hypothetical protein FACS1894164_14420 [Spirochaetia bacterium]|nr:hypothetical protein FACS1894164_14420 [Spirochaetia bacterium]
MKQRFFYFLCAALIVPAFVSAQTQMLIPLSSSIYAEVDALYMIQKLGTPSTARPWTTTETLMILDRIDESKLNGTEARIYNQIRAQVSKPLRFGFDRITRMDASFEGALEMYAHTNSKDYVNEEDWQNNFVKRAPLAKVNLAMGMGSWFSVFSDLQYSYNFNTDDKDQYSYAGAYPGGIGAIIPEIPDGGTEEFKIRTFAPAYAASFMHNWPPHTYDMECVFPKRAFLSFGGEHWNLSFGRDRFEWGNGHSGNFVIGGHRDFDNFVRFSAFTDRFRYEILNTIYDKYDYDGTGIKKSRYFLTHRLEFRILPSLVFTISENIMYQDQSFNIRYLNPAFIYHNWDEKELFNAIAHAELDFAVAPGWNIYMQYTLDQAQAPNENDSESDAWGILAGVEYAGAFNILNRPALLSLSLEAAYTTPLLYRRDRVDFLILNRRLSFNEGDIFSFEYIGYQYGGDTMLLQLDANLRVPGSWDASLRLLGMIHGNINPWASHNKDGDNSGKANYGGSTPSGANSEHESTFVASLRGNYAIPLPVKWPELSAWAQVDIISKTNKLMYDTTGTIPSVIYHKPGISADMQFSIGMRIKL